MAWICQQTLLKKTEKKFGPLLSKIGHYNYKTPGTPGKYIIRPKDDENSLSNEDQKLYRSGVGTLLQFSNKTRPDLCNPVCELSKCMDRTNPAAFKEMLHVIKYLLQTKDYGLKIAPKNTSENKNIIWKLKLYLDSDWASDVTTRKSITGFVILLNDTPILWRSQAQRTVSLSSTEAEYYAMAEATKEIKFVLQVLESLNLQVEKPTIVHMDNVGAIFVAENASATKHTRHIEARYHFVREFIIDGNIKIIFVMSKDNIADMFTKNVISEIFEEHIDNFLIHREVIKLTSKELDTIGISNSGRVSETNIRFRMENANVVSKRESDNSQFSEVTRIEKYLQGKYNPTYHSSRKVQNVITNSHTTRTNKN
jgi:hypothetical protein